MRLSGEVMGRESHLLTQLIVRGQGAMSICADYGLRLETNIQRNIMESKNMLYQKVGSLEGRRKLLRGEI